MHKAIGRQRTVPGRLAREIERKAQSQNGIQNANTSQHMANHTALAAAVQALSTTLARAQRIWSQTASRNSAAGQKKLYAFHAPEVECIGKGKSRQPYEFGVKVGIATTLKGNQHRGKYKSLSASDKRMLKRRQAIEPIIGHLKQDHRMDRCHLKGETGDRLHAVLCAAGYNIKWLLRMIAKKGVSFWSSLFFAPVWACACAKLAWRAGRYAGVQTLVGTTGCTRGLGCAASAHRNCRFLNISGATIYRKKDLLPPDLLR